VLEARVEEILSLLGVVLDLDLVENFIPPQGIAVWLVDVGDIRMKCLDLLAELFRIIYRLVLALSAFSCRN